MKAVVLLSGGLDSTVMLASVLAANRNVLALSFDYRQRNIAELNAAKKIAKYYDVNHKIITIDPHSFDKSALVYTATVPKGRNLEQINAGGIPATYVPARNTLFLAFATAQAEIIEAQEIYLGANAADQKPYPDTRVEYHMAFQGLLNVATKQAVEGSPPQLLFPHSKLSKRDIIGLGISLKAPLELTVSCYDPTDDNHCGRCDACYLRKEGFVAGGYEDPTHYLDGGLPLEAISLNERI